jgi:phosphate:Na+ symporter
MNGAGAWAGLGLFFIGMRLIGGHLQQLGGGPLRALLARTLNRPFVPQLAGFTSGALTQSTSAVTFIAAGLVSAGATTVVGALPLLAWANVGTSALVLLAGLNVKLLVYYLLGAVGLAFFGGLEQREKSRHALLALLGLCLLLLGLSLLKGSVADLRSNPWVHEFLEFAGSAGVVAFLVGFIIATAVQSSSIVTVLALPLVNERLLGLPEVVLMIYGASVGSGFAVLLLAQGMEGASRQLALCQVGLRMAAALVLLPLFAVEATTGFPLVMAGVGQLTTSVTMQCGLVYLAFQITVSLAAALGGPWLCKLAAMLSPEPQTDSALKPAYLFDEGVSDPATALSLAGLEYRRLVGFLPEYLEELRPEEERAPGHLPFKQRVAVNSAVVGEIIGFLSATQNLNPDMTGIDQLYGLRGKVLSLQTLQDNLAEFVAQLGSVSEEERPALAMHMVEGLHLLLGVAAEALEEGDAGADAKDMLEAMTGERGALMERVRKELLGGAQSFAGRESLLSATLLFERLLWLLRRLTT